MTRLLPLLALALLIVGGTIVFTAAHREPKNLLAQARVNGEPIYEWAKRNGRLSERGILIQRGDGEVRL